MKLLFRNIYPLSFYPLLVSFHLQITYRKVRNLQIGVDKLVGKVSIVSCCCNQLTITEIRAKENIHDFHVLVAIREYLQVKILVIRE